MVLAGAAAAIASAAPHATVFDGSAFGLAAFMGTRTNKVGQNFHRKLEAFNYKIKKQKLHREDIKDLVELTTSRMHIYQLVGTLLLAFSMGWYTDSKIWDLPVWYSTLWLLSNYAAVGYLILCVWLAMYAAVAARSIGTRLLTSYARIAYPTKKELDDVKAPIVFNGDSMMNKIRGKLGLKEDQFLDASQTQGANMGKEEMTLSEDDCQHFKRFLDELPRWLVYDTWARVCMTYGMNQLIQALSYFSMASIWPKSPMAAIVSFITLNNLGIILLWLDLGELDQTWWDLFAIVFFSFFPAALAVVLLLQESQLWFGAEAKGILVFVCFLFHGGWLWYLNNVFQYAGSTNGRFQPGNYANVLEWVRPNQNSAGESNQTEGNLDAPVRPKCRTGMVSDKLAPDGHEFHSPSAGLMQDNSLESECSAKKAMNGGRTPGLWETPADAESEAPAVRRSNVWLPVKVVRYFTVSTIVWWAIGGALHGMVIDFDTHNEWKHYHGDESMPPLHPTLLQWPQPARLFKVAGLHCSNSHLWVSSTFSMYAASQEAKTLNNMTLVKDGNVAAVICGPHKCDTLSAPTGDSEWDLAPLEPAVGPASATIPIPHSWRVVAGKWTDCPSASDSCTTAWLAGWDGSRVYAATLQLASTGKWTVHKQFEIDPAIGCEDGYAGCGNQSYSDVKALELGEGGSTLLVLLGTGNLDVWDLAKGTVRERMHVGDGFTSMCHSQQSIFLSKEEASGPVLDRMALPPVFLQLMKPRVLSFVSLGGSTTFATKHIAGFVQTAVNSTKSTVRHLKTLARKLRGAPSLSPTS